MPRSESNFFFFDIVLLVWCSSEALEKKYIHNGVVYWDNYTNKQPLIGNRLVLLGLFVFGLGNNLHKLTPGKQQLDIQTV